MGDRVNYEFILVVLGYFAILAVCFPVAKWFTGFYFARKRIKKNASSETVSPLLQCSGGPRRGKLQRAPSCERDGDSQEKYDHAAPDDASVRRGSSCRGSSPTSTTQAPKLTIKYDREEVVDADEAEPFVALSKEPPSRRRTTQSDSDTEDLEANVEDGASDDDEQLFRTTSKNPESPFSPRQLFAFRRLAVSFFIIGGTQFLVANVRSPLFQEYADPRQEPTAKLHTIWVSMLFNILYGIIAHFTKPKTVASLICVVFGLQQILTAGYVCYLESVGGGKTKVQAVFDGEEGRKAYPGWVLEMFLKKAARERIVYICYYFIGIRNNLIVAMAFSFVQVYARMGQKVRNMNAFTYLVLWEQVGVLLFSFVGLGTRWFEYNDAEAGIVAPGTSSVLAPLADEHEDTSTPHKKHNCCASFGAGVWETVKYTFFGVYLVGRYKYVLFLFLLNALVYPLRAILDIQMALLLNQAVERPGDDGSTLQVPEIEPTWMGTKVVDVKNVVQAGIGIVAAVICTTTVAFAFTDVAIKSDTRKVLLQTPIAIFLVLFVCCMSALCSEQRGLVRLGVEVRRGGDHLATASGAADPPRVDHIQHSDSLVKTLHTTVAWNDANFRQDKRFRGFPNKVEGVEAVWFLEEGERSEKMRVAMEHRRRRSADARRAERAPAREQLLTFPAPPARGEQGEQYLIFNDVRVAPLMDNMLHAQQQQAEAQQHQTQAARDRLRFGEVGHFEDQRAPICHHIRPDRTMTRLGPPRTTKGTIDRVSCDGKVVVYRWQQHQKAELTSDPDVLLNEESFVPLGLVDDKGEVVAPGNNRGTVGVTSRDECLRHCQAYDGAGQGFTSTSQTSSCSHFLFACGNENAELSEDGNWCVAETARKPVIRSGGADETVVEYPKAGGGFSFTPTTYKKKMSNNFCLLAKFLPDKPAWKKYLREEGWREKTKEKAEKIVEEVIKQGQKKFGHQFHQLSHFEKRVGFYELVPERSFHTVARLAEEENAAGLILDVPRDVFVVPETSSGDKEEFFPGILTAVVSHDTFKHQFLREATENFRIKYPAEERTNSENLHHISDADDSDPIHQEPQQNHADLQPHQHQNQQRLFVTLLERKPPITLSYYTGDFFGQNQKSSNEQDPGENMFERLPKMSFLARYLLCSVFYIYLNVAMWCFNAPMINVLYLRTSREVKIQAQSWSKNFGVDVLKILGTLYSNYVNLPMFLPFVNLVLAFAICFLWVVFVIFPAEKEYARLESENEIVGEEKASCVEEMGDVGSGGGVVAGGDLHLHGLD
eukprot:g7164.t1